MNPNPGGLIIDSRPLQCVLFGFLGGAGEPEGTSVQGISSVDQFQDLELTGHTYSQQSDGLVDLLDDSDFNRSHASGKTCRGG